MMKLSACFVAALGVLCGLADGQFRTEFLMGPHVNSVDSSSAKIVWVSDADAPAGEVTLRAGDRVLEFMAVAAAIAERTEVLHTAALTGLEPFTRYRYTVKSGGQTASGAFTTAPDRPVPVKFVVYGDTRSNPERHMVVCVAIAMEEPAFVVHTGDLVADGRTWEQWAPQFFEPAMPMLSSSVIWPVRGNHERDAVLYRALFELPRDELYYSFDFGNVHYVILDTHGAQEERPAMLEWFEKDLAANQGKWIFVSYHVPTFNIGGHGLYSKWGREDFLPVMEKYGVDFVLNGHSHIYERSLPIGRPGAKPINYIVTGGGGAPNYDVVPSPILVGGIGYSGLHHCVFEVDGDRLQMTTKTPEGEVLDQLSLVKKDNAYQQEVMDLALEYEQAEKLQFVFAELKVDFPQVPDAGQQVQTVIETKHIPDGTVVAVSLADGSEGWVLNDQTATVSGGKLAVEATTPEELELGPGGLKPALKVALSFEAEGRSCQADGLGLGLSDGLIRKMYPEPEPVAVLRAPGPIKVDGDLADWAGVDPLPAPYHGADTGSVRLCWHEDGLYGAVTAQDDEIRADPRMPWRGDSLELFLDKKYDRAISRKRRRHASFAFGPNPKKAGQGFARPLWGVGRDKAGAIPCAWQPITGGYVVEFFIPADLLAPARMKVGYKMGMNYSLNNDGESAELFYATKDKGGSKSPITWGVVVLTK